MPACPPVVPGKRQLRVPSSAGLELLSKWVEGAGTELNRVKVKERESNDIFGPREDVYVPLKQIFTHC